MNYSMDDGTVVKTENTTGDWHKEYDERENGPFDDWLHRSRRGRYWIEHIAVGDDRKSRAEWISNHAATQWLLANGHELPQELKPLEAEVAE